MFAATALLTFTTLLGLAVGFAREMLLVASWGATSKTDAFLVAMFLPEAVRMVLTGGLLASAALPLWLQQPAGIAQTRWAVTQTLHLTALGIGLAIVLTSFAGGWVYLVGPGMAPAAHAQAANALHILAWTLPGILLQALLSVFHVARQRYLLCGLGSLIFNLPGVLYLFWYRAAGTMDELALSFVSGSVLMTLILLPFAWNNGWRPTGARPTWDGITTLYRTLVPLLAGSAASQGLTLVERILASQLGEGSIAVLNLARKLINIPLIGLLSLSQVLLSHMSKQIDADNRTELLRTGLTWATLLAVPAAVGLIFGATPLVMLLLPHQVSGTLLPQLISLFSIGVAFGSWNGLFARYFYAQADTRTPLKFELIGNAINLLLALSLPSFFGLAGLPISATTATIAATVLLVLRTPLAPEVGGRALQVGVASAIIFLLWITQHRIVSLSLWPQLLVALSLPVITLAGLTAWLRPWQVRSATDTRPTIEVPQ